MIFKYTLFSGKVQQKQNSPQIALRAVYRIEDLGDTIQAALQCPITKAYNRESYVLSIISSYISNS